MLTRNAYSFSGILAVGLVMALPLLFGACMEKRTKDPEKAFRYWSGGEDPPMDVHVVEGRYWESAHFTKEYELYLEIYAPRYWTDTLIRQNHLQPWSDTLERAFEDVPGWFKPERKMELFIDEPGTFQGVELYRDTTSGRLLLHALQL